MPLPGIADPYWYEWYVGLKYIIRMLNPDSGIESVVFQHPDYRPLDDIVVEYKDGRKQLCLQVKHEISTSKSENLTFGKLLQRDSNTKKCLIKSLYDAWKKANINPDDTIEPVLFTNRHTIERRAGRTYNKTHYSAYSINTFLDKMRNRIKAMASASIFTIDDDDDLAYQWNELRDVLDDSDVSQMLTFLEVFRVEANQPDLKTLHQELQGELASLFSCSLELAQDLFDKLISGLKIWTTTQRGENYKVMVEDVYSLLSIQAEYNESLHRLAPPYPFFESRQEFCHTIEQRINNSDKKVLFLSGNPGSGKTSIVSYLQTSQKTFTLRYHTFRPISPEQHFYDLDSGLCSAENLWGTLLHQLRKIFQGRLAYNSVPINNKLLSTGEIRGHVLRLLAILAQDTVETEKRICVCIDGIDHAARAASDISFLSSLPIPDEIPEGVCFLVVGQPPELYQNQYPHWLTYGLDVERIDMPLLSIEDIQQLVLDEASQFKDASDNIAALVHHYTEGNNLSAIFAVKEIRDAASVEEVLKILQEKEICADIQQYYAHIWAHAKKELQSIGLSIPYPEIMISCPILLMNGRVNTRILANSINPSLDECSWTMILDQLYPLVMPCTTKGEYTLFHNDFRIFLTRIIRTYEPRYKEIAQSMAIYFLENDEGLLSYVSGIHLLKCAGRSDLIPKYFTPEFVIAALAEGISEQRLDEYAQLSFESACNERDFEGLLNTYLAIKTIRQHKRYFEYHDRTYHSNDYSGLLSIDSLEFQTHPLSNDNLEEYERVLDLCKELHTAGTNEFQKRAQKLYKMWFDSIEPHAVMPLYLESSSPDERPYFKATPIFLFLKHWGKTAAILQIPITCTATHVSNDASHIEFAFGEAYFEQCIEQENFTLAVTAIQENYISIDFFSEKLDYIYYKGFSKYFVDALRIAATKLTKSSEWLLPSAICATLQRDYKIEPSLAKHYDFKSTLPNDTKLNAVLYAFLLGMQEHFLDDIVVCGHAHALHETLEKDTSDAEYDIILIRFACLLGKYYWHESKKFSMAFMKYLKLFLKTIPNRPFDFSKARHFLLFTLLHSKPASSLCDNKIYVESLKSFLLEGSHFNVYYKSCILDYFAQNNRLDIVKDFILQLYGKNCSVISQDPDKKELHAHFQAYGDLVLPEMMMDFSDRLKWDIVNYSGSHEEALRGPSDCFEYISSKEPSSWRNLGIELYQQSYFADNYDNEYSGIICKNLLAAAAKCSFSDFWELHYLSDDFHMDPELIYHALFEFIPQAKSLFELEIIWLLNCGIHSWYMAEHQNGAQCVYNACLKRSQDLSVNFRETVRVLTPQWLTIIDHINESSFTSTEEIYTSKNNTEIEMIKAEYSGRCIEELESLLLSIPSSSYSEKRYLIILEQMLEKTAFTKNNAQSLLESMCVYMRDHRWSEPDIFALLDNLIRVLGEEAFWTLSLSQAENLTDYDYQISEYNLWLLLKTFYARTEQGIRHLFYEELHTQQLWITGNSHLDIQLSMRPLKKQFVQPNSLSEIVLYILLEQLTTMNTRKVESATHALYILGKHSSEVIPALVENWKNLLPIQKELLFPIFIRWANEDIDLCGLLAKLNEDYSICNSLTEKYYLHTILCALHVDGVNNDRISCDTPASIYQLPEPSWGIERPRLYEAFLSLQEEASAVDDINDDIREFIAINKSVPKCEERKYYSREDIHFWQRNQAIEQMLYGEEKKGRWNNIPLIYKKCRLLPVEDPYIITDMPQMTFESDWFMSSQDSNFEERTHKEINKDELLRIANKNLSENETLLAAFFSYPDSRGTGIEYFVSSKIERLDSIIQDDTFDCCFGNFGLLARQGPLNETHFTHLGTGGISLFNRLSGTRILCFGNCQLVPSAAWRKILHCSPSASTPYVWTDENGNSVLKFERFASPSQGLLKKIYHYQPVLMRWVCDSSWFEKTIRSHKLYLRYIISQEPFFSYE